MIKQGTQISQENESDIKLIEARLRGRQSVRTTFRLPVELIEVLSLLAGQFGVKRKSLFDQLVEDGALLHRVADSVTVIEKEDGRQRRPKSFVLSKRTLQVLQQVAKARRIPRDVLVEVAIRRFLPLLLAERDNHRKRLAIHGELEKLQAQGRELLARSEVLLGENDPVTEVIAEMVRTGEDKLQAVRQVLARGSALLELPLERLAEVGDRGGRS